MGGILKGRTGFLGRSRASLDELKALGERTTRAALATLEKLTRTPVETGESRVFLVPEERLAAVLAAHDDAEVAARFRFSGTAAGMTGLVLAKGDAMRLAELLLGRDAGSVKRFGQLEESTIAETANIALNGALNALAREDGVRFQPEVPEVRHGVAPLAPFFAPTGGAGHVAVVETRYREPTRGVNGTFLVLFALE